MSIFISPTEGFSLQLNAKKIGPGMKAEPIKLTSIRSAEETANNPEAYEKLILDCLNGDATNFTHWDEVASSWELSIASEKRGTKPLWNSLIIQAALWVR